MFCIGLVVALCSFMLYNICGVTLREGLSKKGKTAPKKKIAPVKKLSKKQQAAADKKTAADAKTAADKKTADEKAAADATLLSAAAAVGFNSVAEQTAAAEKGFKTKSAQTNAELKGFTTQAQVNTGFQNITDYNLATEAGFTSNAKLMTILQFNHFTTKSGVKVTDINTFADFAKDYNMSVSDAAANYIGQYLFYDPSFKS